jgi:hypothetical protein
MRMLGTELILRLNATKLPECAKLMQIAVDYAKQKGG